MKKVQCRVGGWQILAIPGTEFTFGTGATSSGPIPLSEVTDEDIVEGFAVAIAIAKENRGENCE